MDHGVQWELRDELFQLPGGGASKRKGHLNLALKDETQGDIRKNFGIDKIMHKLFIV